MNWNMIEGEWKQWVGHAKQTWANLTDDDLVYIDGKRDRLMGRLQQRCGIEQDQAIKEIDDWAESLKVSVHH